MRRAPTPDSTIARLASRQLGLVTRSQLAAAGITDAERRHRVDIGLLVPIAPGRYRIAGAPRTWEQRALAACLIAGANAVLCRRAAASVWHFDLPPPKVIDVAIADRRGRPLARGDVRIHRVASLPAADCTTVGLLPVTTAVRTLIDLAGELDPVVLRRVVDEPLAEQLVSPRRLSDAMSRLGGRGRHGIAALRSELALWMEAPELASVPEAEALRLLLGSGLPRPVSQHEVTLSSGRTARLDFAWPEHKVALEMDGFRWHGGPRERDRDSRRENALAADDWIVLRTTPRELACAPAAVEAALRGRGAFASH